LKFSHNGNRWRKGTFHARLYVMHFLQNFISYSAFHYPHMACNYKFDQNLEIFGLQHQPFTDQQEIWHTLVNPNKNICHCFGKQKSATPEGCKDQKKFTSVRKIVTPQQQQLFYCLYPGLLGWASTRKNIHPLTPIMIINQPLSISSICYDEWHPPFSICEFDSLSAQPVQVIFSLPLGLELCTSYSIHFFTQTLSAFCDTSPYHRNPFCCSTEIMSSIPSFSLNPLLKTLSFSLMSYIQIIILISARWSGTSFSLIIGQISLPCHASNLTEFGIFEALIHTFCHKLG